MRQNIIPEVLLSEAIMPIQLHYTYHVLGLLQVFHLQRNRQHSNHPSTVLNFPSIRIL
jgi:hypothetical protein